ncbi:hypothetical protein L6164_005713 [Bauhinia variegata]|uniref:Uncharacterized protein n=1 Tax=Bauhinia variegata TaxID=167791 RepID=A0ACB9PS51_BAUVA|nr:hypothetical protein L6164_005713 [Bauhinia variegata]
MLTKLIKNKWFEKNPHFHKQAKQGQNQFLQNKSQVLASLAGMATQGDFITQLEEILQQLKLKSFSSAVSSNVSSNSGSNPTAENDDEDCLGIENISIL